MRTTYAEPRNDNNIKGILCNDPMKVKVSSTTTRTLSQTTHLPDTAFRHFSPFPQPSNVIKKNFLFLIKFLPLNLPLKHPLLKRPLPCITLFWLALKTMRQPFGVLEASKDAVFSSIQNTQTQHDHLLLPRKPTAHLSTRCITAGHTDLQCAAKLPNSRTPIQIKPTTPTPKTTTRASKLHWPRIHT